VFNAFDLTGRGVVITGGNGGIGYAMAGALLSAGATVAIWGSNPGKTERAKAALAAACGDASPARLADLHLADGGAGLGVGQRDLLEHLRRLDTPDSVDAPVHVTRDARRSQC
jgi:NAD(P)-dependent dehydrogenase (short-subunit alcohol dehydrogenase family)